MICHFDGCNKKARSKSSGICEMHYYRMRRNGSYNLPHKEKPNETVISSNGYVRKYMENGHNLTNYKWIYEHRLVAYEKYGDNLPDCELCGVQLGWSNAHIDHIDENKQNNNADNLRPLCSICNTRRNYPLEHLCSRKHPITFNGKTQTAAGWARENNVYVNSSTIHRRMKSGMSVEESLFSPPKTHNKEYERMVKEDDTNFVSWQ